MAIGSSRYDELYDRAGRCAGVLQGLGVQREDRVCILSFNSHRNLEALFGTVWAGGIAAPLNYRLAPAELAAIVEMVEARVLLVDDEFLALEPAVARAGGVPGACDPDVRCRRAGRRPPL